jgi:hypothetical protein
LGKGRNRRGAGLGSGVHFYRQPVNLLSA